MNKLEIKQQRFTMKYPILYTIHLTDTVLSSIDGDKMSKVLEWLETKQYDTFKTMALKDRNKLIIAGVAL